MKKTVPPAAETLLPASLPAALLSVSQPALSVEAVPAEHEPLPGSIVLQFIRCGKPGCRCQTGERHGPYHYRVWREGSRVKKVYVPINRLDQVTRQCAQHQLYADQLKRIVAEGEKLRQSIRHQITRRKSAF